MSNIESVLVENRVFPPSEQAVKARAFPAWRPTRHFATRPRRILKAFWARLARDNVVWTKPFTKVLDESKAPFYRWFDDGELNASANCLDKHIGTPTENKTAIIFEADDGAVTRVTYKELLAPREPVRQRAQGAGHQEGRPRHHLHADVDRGRGSHAGLRAHRRDAHRSCSAASRPRR